MPRHRVTSSPATMLSSIPTNKGANARQQANRRHHLRYSWALLATPILLLVSRGAVAADPVEAALTTCWSCHGSAGEPKDPTIPIIWGQLAPYLEKQLRDY